MKEESRELTERDRLQAREDQETDKEEKKLKNAQKPEEVKIEKWRVWKMKAFSHRHQAQLAAVPA